MKLSLTLQKIADGLLRSKFGWLTPDGNLEAEPFKDYEHQNILDKNADKLGKRNPSYLDAFSQGWIRWYIQGAKLGFEGTREGFQKEHSQILKIIGDAAKNDVLIDLVSPKADLLKSYHFASASAAEKAFFRGGIQDLENYNASGSILRKFL